jgi:predicted extracellular nuclease
MNSMLQRPLSSFNTALLRALPLALAGFVMTGTAQAAVLISQVYGGGGNSGATLQHDFIEIFNSGNAAVNIGGWSVQYASGTGTSWQFTAIPAGTSLAPGRYFLVRQAQGAGGTVPVNGDIAGTIAMGAANGKVALSNTSAALSGNPPTGASVLDIVSYGSATPTEGTPTGALSSTTAALRKAGGCTDTNDNSADFTVEAPNPRNGTAPANTNCEGGGGPGPLPEPVARTIPAIQGSGAVSPFAGSLVVTTGVVTKLLSNGFFIQDPVGDGNAATSDGIFVFTSAAPPAAAAVGSLVSVTGTVLEFSSGAGTAATPLTQIGGSPTVALLGSGSAITSVAITLPVAEGDSLERFEGMLVSISSAMTVQQNFFQARFGQLTLGVGRHETPTNRFRPGAQANALAEQQARSRVLLDDSSSAQNPSPTPYFSGNGLPRAGDTVSNLVGVLDFGLASSSASGPGLYRLQPTAAPVFAAANPRTPAPAPVGGNVKLSAMNVLNYFTTFTNGGTASGQTGQGCSLGGSVTAGNCRGANNLAEFQRQQAKIVLALAGLNADAVGLMEIQNNGNAAAQNLVDALNAQVGAGTYATVELPAQTTGTDAIRVAMIYKPARLTAVGLPLSDPDPVNSRPTLAQTFTAANGEKFSLVVNHLKSKGSCPSPSDPDAPGNVDSGDGQGCWNLQRTQQAQRLRTFVAQVQTASGSADAVLVGDMNAYGQEDPIFELTGNGYVDEALRRNPFAYGYVFDGKAGRLDYALSTGAMSPKITGAAAWHINADEQVSYDYNLEFKAPLTTCGGMLCPADPYNADPYRSSDHDPLLIGLDLYKTVVATTVRELLAGTAGADRFVFSSVLQGGDSIFGFQSGIDQIVVKDILRGVGRSAVTDPLGGGFITCVASRRGAVIGIDTDGTAGSLPSRALVQLNGLTCAEVMTLQNFVVR